MSSILIKNARIIDPESVFHNQLADVRLVEGIIRDLGIDLEEADSEVINFPNLHVSKGWIDSFSTLCDPGYEHRETIETAIKSAASGGFTTLITSPLTFPVVDNKTAVRFLVSRGSGNVVDIQPLGALTEGARGEALSEMYDMFQHGAVGFTDGKKATDTAVLLKALQYNMQFGGTVVSFAYNQSLNKNGQVNEGLQSAITGLKGIPSLAEELQVERDLSIAEYTGGKIHFGCISTKGALQRIIEARKKGVFVSCSVAAHQVAFDDSVVNEFDSNHKVWPPYRSAKDVEFLLQGLVDGHIQAVCSDHTPVDIEGKNLEFDLAEFGIISLQTTFANLNTQLKRFCTITQIIEKLTSGPARIFGLPQEKIEIGAKANLTLFDPEANWVFEKDRNKSKSENSPFFGQSLKGKVYGVFNNGQIHLNS